MKRAIALAHPNIALSKYWGKRPGLGNYPAVPSLSVTLDGLATKTTVTFDEALSVDALTLNGRTEAGEPLARTTELLDRVRSAAGFATFASVESTNDFPTASGLASSASGFAAMALAAVRAAGLDWSDARVSDLARRSSASAARSLFGGFVELPAGVETPTGGEVLSATPFAPASAMPLRVLIAVTTEEAKSVASRDGMRTTASASPYYGAWLSAAPELHRRVRDAISRGDFIAMGEAAEASALAMHASAMAAGVVYFRGATLDVLAKVRAMRREIPAFATMDAGPHVKVLVSGDEHAAYASAALRETPGVLRVIETTLGGPARIVEKGEP